MRLFTKEPWPTEEVSTRNCFNAKFQTPNCVRCSEGKVIRLTYNQVIRGPKLADPCDGCPKMDNDWGAS